MKLQRLIPLAVAALASACMTDPTAPLADELVLAQRAQSIAETEATTSQAHYAGWLHRLIDALRATDDPEALAFLEQARAFREQARAAFEAGDYTAAREFHRLAFRAVVAAVIEIYPNAPVRTGEVVDNVLARIDAFLGDREAPRIRRILAHVRELRAMALATDDPVTALILNARALQILHGLVHHVRERIEDHDEVADGEMHALSY
jgi:HEPN domain-containing protein